jgi:hypothetical protein
MENSPETSILYTASCVVSDFETRHSARHAEDNILPIRFDDLTSDALGRWGPDADTAAQGLFSGRKDAGDTVSLRPYQTNRRSFRSPWLWISSMA